MTSLEAKQIVERQRKLILAGDVEIESEVDYPIATNPLDAQRPYIVTHDVTFRVAGRERVVRAGFTFDGASIPAIVTVARLLVPLALGHWIRPAKAREFWGRLLKPLNTFYRNLYAACLHDADYAQQTYAGRPIDRVIADACYQSVLVHCGENYRIARAERIALDWCGGWAWAEHRRRIDHERGS